MPPRPPKHAVSIAPEYLAELRARVQNGPGVEAVAKAARISRQTVWRTISEIGGRPPTFDGVEHIRRALAKLQPEMPPMPPAVISVRGTDHYAWLKLADSISADDLASIAADPAAVVAATLRSGRRRK